ncbi:MAG: recombinase family protein, partial [Candidatus Paceibacterota bacterium]
MKTNQYLAYIRVSTTKQGENGVSLDEQREAIQRYAQKNGLEISRWFEERVTAAKRGRRVFGEMLSLLKRGNVAGVIIHKIDRGARNLKDWADMGELIDQGLDVHFANESLDLSSRGGRLSADIQAVVAADYIRNLREETKKGFYGRLKQGLYPMQAPVGYLDCGGGEPKIPDPERAQFVRRLIELYSTGSFSIEELVEKAERMGLTNRRGGRISVNGLWTILRNPFYAGVIRIQKSGETFEGVHEPIINAELFGRVQAVLEGRSNCRSSSHNFLFRRLFVCANCGYAMTGEHQKSYVYYRCHSRHCTSSVREEWIYHVVGSRFNSLSWDAKLQKQLGEALENWESTEHRDREKYISNLRLKLDQYDRLLDRLVDGFLSGSIEEPIYLRKKEAYLMSRLKLRDEINAAESDVTLVGEELRSYFELSNTALLTFRKGTWQQKREVLKETTSNRCVQGKKVYVELDEPYRLLASCSSITSGDP